jgi:hypothetical protein
VASWDKHLSF